MVWSDRCMRLVEKYEGGKCTAILCLRGWLGAQHAAVAR
jgi:hypothetical protein